MDERVTLEQAFETIDRVVQPLVAEPVEVMLAGGRILAEPASAWVDLPGADTSVLDGFALRAADTAGAGPAHKIKLRIVGNSSFDSPYSGRLPANSCVQIHAGALLPEETDAVVGRERVKADQAEIELEQPVAAGDAVRRRALEFRMGEVIAEPGTRLSPGWISTLIAAGWSEINTVNLPRVRVIAVGDELKSPGRTLDPGEVFPSAAAGIVAWLRMNGVSEVRLNVVPDTVFDIQEELPEYLGADLVITLGGTGMSERDLVIKALAERGVEYLFRGVAARPGHYAAFGVLDQVPVISLPGGPSAAEMMFQLLVRRTFGRLTGLPEAGLPVQPAELAAELKAKEGVDSLVRVGLKMNDRGLTATPLREKSLHLEIAKAQGIVRVHAGKDLAAGSPVPVWVTG